MNSFFGILAAFTFMAPQPQVPRPAGLYATAHEFMAGQPSQPGTDARANFLHTKAVVINRPSATEKCVSKTSIDAVWGYVEHDGTGWRIFKGEPYQIEAIDSLMVYSRRISTGRTNHVYYYFSSGLTSSVKDFTRANLRQAFADNPRFLSLLNTLHWYQSPAGWDNATRQYRAVALYQLSLRQ